MSDPSGHDSFTSDAFAAPEDLARWQRRSLVVGGAAGLASLAGLLLDRAQFFHSYWISLLFWLGIALGCLALVMLQHLTAGAWGLVGRRILEASSRTLPLLALLTLPVAFGMSDLFVWSRPEVMATDTVLQAKQAYLNDLGFWLRAALYFAIWISLAFVLSRGSARQDIGADPDWGHRMRVISAPGLALYALAASFASFDWLMSLNPHWHSEIYGVYFVGTHAVAGLTFLIVVAAYLVGREPMAEVFQPRHFHDYGKLLLAFLMLWAYFTLSQFLIVWSGNVPERASWYVARRQGGWQYVSFLLVMLHFFVPFLLLLSRSIKRHPGRLAVIAAGLFFARWLDLLWQAGPSFTESLSLHLLDLTTLVGIGGLWLAWFLRELQRHPLLPLHDPHLAMALRHD